MDTLKFCYFIAQNSRKREYATNYELYTIREPEDVIESNCDFKRFAEYNVEGQDSDWEYIADNAGITIETRDDPRGAIVETIFSDKFFTRYIKQVE